MAARRQPHPYQEETGRKQDDKMVRWFCDNFRTVDNMEQVMMNPVKTVSVEDFHYCVKEF